jgi:hypothetical protein
MLESVSQDSTTYYPQGTVGYHFLVICSYTKTWYFAIFSSTKRQGSS